jgi:hypothetical protein
MTDVGHKIPPYLIIEPSRIRFIGRGILRAHAADQARFGGRTGEHQLRPVFAGRHTVVPDLVGRRTSQGPRRRHDPGVATDENPDHECADHGEHDNYEHHPPIVSSEEGNL